MASRPAAASKPAPPAWVEEGSSTAHRREPGRPGPPRAPSLVAVPRQEEAPTPAKRTPAEPVWLVRIVLLLFLVGFAAFLARDVSGVVVDLFNW